MPERVRLTRSKRSRFWISPALSGHLGKNRRLKVCGACGDVKQRRRERERKRASWREARFKTLLYYRVLPVLNREHLINHWCFSSQSKMEKSHGHSWLIHLWAFFLCPQYYRGPLDKGFEGSFLEAYILSVFNRCIFTFQIFPATICFSLPYLLY